MILWRLSGRDHARRFDGGYGLAHHGRWNTRGRPLTYCATSAALCLLEKLIHVEDPGLIPDNLFMVRYDAPDDLGMELLEPRDLPANWRRSEAVTQALGDAWLDAGAAPLLSVPSIILPIAVGYGVHPVHLGIIFLANLQIGYITPPVGMNLFIASYRLEKPVMEIFRATLPFFFILLACLVIITYWPTLSLLLVEGAAR